MWKKNYQNFISRCSYQLWTIRIKGNVINTKIYFNVTWKLCGVWRRTKETCLKMKVFHRFHMQSQTLQNCKPHERIYLLRRGTVSNCDLKTFDDFICVTHEHEMLSNACSKHLTHSFCQTHQNFKHEVFIFIDFKTLCWWYKQKPYQTGAWSLSWTLSTHVGIALITES